jgi:hypothetical protein
MDTRLPADQALRGVTAEGVVPLCPYSEETVVGCRYYRPRSAHGGFPGAGRCADAEIVSADRHIRQTICRRRERVQ